MKVTRDSRNQDIHLTSQVTTNSKGNYYLPLLPYHSIYRYIHKKLRKTHINLVMSVCLPVLLSIRVKQLGFPSMSFDRSGKLLLVSPLQPFWVPVSTPAQLMTIFYCLTALGAVQSLWVNFRENLCGGGLLKSLDIIQLSLKLGRDNGPSPFYRVSLPPSLSYSTNESTLGLPWERSNGYHIH
jgi:hypothetical protein